MAKHIFNESQLPNYTWLTRKQIIDSGDSDCAILFEQYAYYANLQQTNQPRVKTNALADSLKWGRDKVQKVRNKLEKLGYIEVVKKRSSGHFPTHFIKVNHLIGYAKIQSLPQPENTFVVPQPENTATGNQAATLRIIGNLKDNNLEEEENLEKKNSQKGEDRVILPTHPILTATNRDKARPVSTVTVPDIDVKVDEIITFARDFWANEAYTAEGEEEPITPVTRANIIKRLKEGFTVTQFKKAIEDSTFWSAGVPRTLGNMTKTKGKFNSYVTWQSRIEEQREAWEMKNKNGKYAYKLRKQE